MNLTQIEIKSLKEIIKLVRARADTQKAREFHLRFSNLSKNGCVENAGKDFAGLYHLLDDRFQVQKPKKQFADLNDEQLADRVIDHAEHVLREEDYESVFRFGIIAIEYEKAIIPVTEVCRGDWDFILFKSLEQPVVYFADILMGGVGMYLVVVKTDFDESIESESLADVTRKVHDLRSKLR